MNRKGLKRVTGSSQIDAVWAIGLGLIVICAMFLLPAPSQAEPDLRQFVNKKNHFIIMRHARAPGTGDPANFRIGDCSTQRNLSRTGREQAARIGKRFRDAGLKTTKVYSSQWCRCLETARLLNVGPVEELSALNSFFETPEQEESRMKTLRDWIASADLSRPVVLVTHQVNITALTDVFPAEGEFLVIRRDPDGLKVMGRYREK